MSFESKTTLVGVRGQSAQLLIVAKESRPLITQWKGLITWGDNQTETIPITDFVGGVSTFSVGHTYRDDGWYSIVVKTEAVEYPTAHPVYVSLRANVKAGPVRFDQPPYVQGPIGPNPNGFPSPEQWNFNLGQDAAYVQCGVYLLLMTRKGERLMDPDFGTGLSGLVFELDTPVLMVKIQDEIQQAFRRYATRVSLTTLVVERDPEARAVLVSAGCQIDGQPFSVKVPFIK